MITGNVVPGNTVIVNVIQDRETGFAGTVYVEFRVIWLSLFLVSGGGPGIVAPSVGHLIGWGHLFAIRGPEPAVQVLGFQIGTVFASFKVAQAARGPNIRHII